MKSIFCVIVFLLLLSCNHKSREDEASVVKVSLIEKEVSILDVFDRLEVIPLETTDSNLLIWPDKVLIENGKIGIFDAKHPTLFVFDENGKFLRKIGRKGNGPGEYREVYDVIIEPESGNFQMISPFGSIFSYTPDGDFIERIRLPERANYQAFENLGDCYLTWSSPMEGERAISIISKKTKQLVSELYEGNQNLGSLYPRKFYEYKNEMFFFDCFHREVYKVTKDSLILSFQWDFGKDNYDIAACGYTNKTTDRPIDGKKMLRDLRDFTIPYIISKQDQTDAFYYAELVYGFVPTGDCHLFKMKSDDKVFVFKKTKEGIGLNPLLFAQDYMVCLASSEELECYKGVLNEEELLKIANRGEEDNPCLIKYYYK